MRRLDYTKAIELRLTGKSYNEIAKDLDVGKSLLSYWLRDLELPLEAKKILEVKSSYPREKFAEYNRQKHERVQKENRQIRESSQKKIKAIKSYELLLLGAALYWAEGYKRHGGKIPTAYLSFSNSDPNMVKVFLRFAREVLKVSEEKVKPRIHLYPSTEKEDAIRFWSEITSISKERFSTSVQVSRASQGKRPKNLLPNGTLDLRIHSRQKFFEVMGLIDGLIKKII